VSSCGRCGCHLAPAQERCSCGDAAIAAEIAQWLRDTYDEEGVLDIAERIEEMDWQTGRQR
jgi:hypothetical protein